MFNANTYTNLFSYTIPTITNTIIKKVPCDGSHPLSILLFFVFLFITLFYGTPFIKNFIQERNIVSIKDFVFTCFGFSGLLTTILFLI